MLKRGYALLIAVAFAGPGASFSATAPAETELATATFAGGCFWCMEPPYDGLIGVVETISGYTGGHKANPTYREVSAGGTGHAEAVQIIYDPDKISYQQLVDVFWKNIDPTVGDRQFCDVGNQYRPAIFFHDETQRLIAEASKAAIEQTYRFEKPIATEITEVSAFYPAEDYHQNYYRKNPIRYKFYRYSCGRDQRLQELWGESQ